MLLSDHFQLRHRDVENDHQAKPEQKDGDREQPDEPRDRRMGSDVLIACAVLRDGNDHASRSLSALQLGHGNPRDRGRTPTKRLADVTDRLTIRS